jgi:hypothetical protein
MTGFAFARSAIDRAGGELRLRTVARELVAEAPGRMTRSYRVDIIEDVSGIGVELELRFPVVRFWRLTSAVASRSSAVRADQRADAGRDRDALAAELRRLVAVEDDRVAFEALDPLEQRAMDGDR